MIYVLLGIEEGSDELLKVDYVGTDEDKAWYADFHRQLQELQIWGDGIHLETWTKEKGLSWACKFDLNRKLQQEREELEEKLKKSQELTRRVNKAYDKA